MCICVHWHFLPLPSCNKGESALLPSELRSSWSWSFYGPWVLSYFLKVLLLQLPPTPLKQPVLFFSMGLLLIFLHPFTAYCLKKTCLHTFLHCLPLITFQNSQIASLPLSVHQNVSYQGYQEFPCCQEQWMICVLVLFSLSVALDPGDYFLF